MNEFKSGDIVINDGSKYTYACLHPTTSGLSIVIDNNGGSAVFFTKYLNLEPKTHSVNFFEVPAPISKDDLREAADNVYCFSSTYIEGYIEINKSKVEPVAFKCGFVFKKESDIKKNIAALQGINPDGVE